MSAPITIEINGEARTLRAPLTVRELLTELALPVERLAIELNRGLLPRTEFERALADGDRLEIVTFVGGG